MFNLISRSLIEFILAAMLSLLLYLPVVARAAPISDDVSEGRIVDAAIQSERYVQAETMLAAWKNSTFPAIEVEAQLLAAELRLARDNDASTLPLFLGMTEIEEYSCRANRGAGIAYAHKQDWKSAVRHLADVTASCPDHWKAWNTMAVALSGMQEWQASRYAFLKALDHSGRRADVLNNFGQSSLDQGSYSEALGYFAAALAKEPANKRFQNNHDIAGASLGLRPTRRADDSLERWGRRLNNAGRAAYLAGYEELGRKMLVASLIDNSRISQRTLVNLEKLDPKGARP